MYTTLNIRNQTYNPEYVKTLERLNRELKEELGKEKVDKKKIQKIREQQLMCGLMMDGGLFRNNRRNIPW